MTLFALDTDQFVAFVGSTQAEREAFKSFLDSNFDADSIVIQENFYLPTDYTDDVVHVNVLINQKTGKAVAFSDFEPGC